MKTNIAHRVSRAYLHKNDKNDEPMTLDVDINISCTHCGTTNIQRTEICKEKDEVEVMCYGCAAVYLVKLRTHLKFQTSYKRISSPLVPKRELKR